MRSTAMMCSTLVTCLALAIPTRAPAGVDDVCGPSPLAAAQSWRNEFPNNAVQNADEQEDCEKLCKVWRSTCHGIVKVSAKCARGLGGNVFKLLGAECKAEVDPATEKECKAEVAAGRTAFKEALRAEVVPAEDFCDDQIGNCTLDCVDDDPL